MALIFTMFSFSLAMSISPGPVNLITMSSGANNGFFRTFPFVSGATIGFTLLLLAVGLGLSSVLSNFGRLLDIMVYAGSIYIAYMGIQLASSSGELSTEEARVPKFIDGFLLQWLNPKAWAACIAGVSAFSTDGAYTTLLLFSGIYFLICYVSIALWAFVGFKASSLLLTPSRLKSFNFVMGSGLIMVSCYLISQHMGY